MRSESFAHLQAIRPVVAVLSNLNEIESQNMSGDSAPAGTIPGTTRITQGIISN